MIKKLFSYFTITFIYIFCVSCSIATSNKNETTVLTEIQEVSKPVEQMMNDVKDITPNKTYTTDELIKNALLKHYNNQFGETDATYKTTGFKMYLIEDISPTEKRAYGYANYMEYNIENGELVNTAGSSATGIVITFSNDGSNSHVNYEILTDDDVYSNEFKNAFPKAIQDKFINRNQADIAEVEKKQEEMLQSLINNK